MPRLALYIAWAWFALASQAQTACYQFQVLAYPVEHMETVPTGINNSGVVVGYYRPLQGENEAHGFIYRKGTYETFDFPGATVTTLYAINDKGDLLGNTQVNGESVAMLQSGETLTTISAPGATGTIVLGINNAGSVVGILLDRTGIFGTHGFLYTQGNYIPIDYPGQEGATSLADINDAGVIVGNFGETIDSKGFAYYRDQFVPLLPPGVRQQFTITSINNRGQIAAEYVDGAKWNPVLYQDGRFLPIELNGITNHSVTVNGLNDHGHIVGQIDRQGYVAAPVRCGSSPNVQP